MLPGWANALNNIHPLLYLSILILSGYAGGVLVSRLGLPRIMGYLVMGMILSPSLLGVFSEEILTGPLTLVTDLALAVIAFSIGSALKLGQLHKLGKVIFSTLMWETVTVFVSVSGAAGWYLSTVRPGGISLELAWAVAILIGAVSAPTAPAPILAVVHEYKARGPLTNVLLGVVTLDDGITIIFFSIATAVASSLIGDGSHLTIKVLQGPLLKIGLSLGLGAAGGLLLRVVSRITRSRDSVLVMALGAIFLVSGAADTASASPLMATMTLGFVTANFVSQPDRWFEEVERLEEPLFAMFFVMAGAHLKLEVLASAGFLTIIVIFVRTAAKFLGSYTGARISKAPKSIRGLLPIGLLPQAGVTLGLVIAARAILKDNPIADVMVNVVLASVIVNELVSPVMIRFALSRAGEIPKSEMVEGELE